jgi:hypothetical protein
MPIFSKKRPISLSLFALMLIISAKTNDGEPFSFYKTFINPDYIEAEFDDFPLDNKSNDESVDLESVPESELE